MTEKKQPWWKRVGGLSDLSEELSGQQWGWDRRSSGNHKQTGLFTGAGSGRDLAVSGVSILRRMTMDMTSRIIRISIPCSEIWMTWRS